MEPRKIIFLVASLVATLLLMIPLASFLSSTLVTTTEKPNPQSTHTVELQKNIRKNTVFFRVKAGGKTVFRSPAFSRLPLDYREQIVWDPKGKRFFFEVAGKRLFGYDTLEKRELTAAEVFDIPLSGFFQMQYRGKPHRHPDAPPEEEELPSWIPKRPANAQNSLLPRPPSASSPTDRPPNPAGLTAPPAFDFQLVE